MEKRDRVRWIYSSRDNQELAERYDQWAKDYDADLEAEFGWRGLHRAVDFLVRYVAKSARILDAGAGTRQMGELLAEQGYDNLIAMDLSSGILEGDRKKNAYREFHQMVMGETLDLPTNSFDAVISIGVLTVGRAPASSLDELTRITRPGGHIIYSLRPDVYRDSGFKEKQANLEADRQWKLAEVSEEFQPLPRGGPDVYHQIWVYQIA